MARRRIWLLRQRVFCEHMEHIVTVETLEYLYNGGRLSKTSAVLGGVLDLKPIIEVNDDGALVAIEKVRGRHKSLKRCVELVGERGVELDKQVIGVVHGNDPETCEKGQCDADGEVSLPWHHQVLGWMRYRCAYGPGYHRYCVPQCQ